MVQSGVRVVREAMGTLGGSPPGRLGNRVYVVSRAQRPPSHRGEPRDCGGRCPVRWGMTGAFGFGQEELQRCGVSGE